MAQNTLEAGAQFKYLDCLRPAPRAQGNLLCLNSDFPSEVTYQGQR